MVGGHPLHPMATAISTLSILLTMHIFQAVAGVGVNYGRVANNLPPPHEVAQFLAHSTTIDHVKLYDADDTVLRAFSLTGIAIDVAVPNNLIPTLATFSSAESWLRTTILPHTPTTNISRILVGNEVLSTSNATLTAALLPAMQNLHTALAAASLHHTIKISTPHSLSVLAASSPPSAGQFRESYAHVLEPILGFLRATASPFMVNAYPFFGFTPGDNNNLEYALFRPNAGVTDGGTGLVYGNMMDAQLDATYSAMRRVGFGDVAIAVAETGWPSAGEEWQAGVGVENARDYNRNLVRHLSSGVGTPLMPNRTIEVFVFALFNENMKPGPASERNFGLFYPDMTPVYDAEMLRVEPGEHHKAKPPPPVAATAGRRWCVPKSNSNVELLQANIDYACGQGIDCRPIQEGGACFFPNTVEAHAAYAMNVYYQMTGRNVFDCDFRATGVITSVDPSYGNCRFQP